MPTGGGGKYIEDFDSWQHRLVDAVEGMRRMKNGQGIRITWSADGRTPTISIMPGWGGTGGGYDSFFALADSSDYVTPTYQFNIGAGYAKINGKILSIAAVSNMAIPGGFITSGGGTVGFLVAKFSLDTGTPKQPQFDSYEVMTEANYLGLITAGTLRHLIGRVWGDNAASPATIYVQQDQFGPIVDSIYQDCPT